MSVEFLYPLGFLAATAVIIPVLLHLWRKEKRKVLQVGSTKLFGNIKKHRINRLRIKNWPLLLLRCLLILALSCLLAAPHIASDRPGSNETGWILLGTAYHENLAESQRILMDSLLNNGYGLRAFEPGFRKISMQDADTVSQSANPFALIHQLNDILPAGFPVVVFSSPQISQLTGDVPATTLALTWHAFAQRDTSRVQWAAQAWNTASDSIAVIVGSSSTDDTHFEQLVVQADGSEQGVQVRVEQGQTLVKLDGQSEWVAVNDHKFQIRFASDTPLPDLGYLRALLAAFQQATDFPMEMATYQPGESCDILFDLTEAGLPDTALAAATIFRYASGVPEDQQNNYVIPANTQADRAMASVYKLIVAEDKDTPVWQDAFGRPLLTVSRQQGYTLFRCYTRFNPQWTDLIWSEAFINSMIPLFVNTKEPLLVSSFHTYSQDKRAFVGTVSLPHRAKTAQDIGQVPNQANTIPYLAWIALLIFAAERIVTYHYKIKTE
ncbi:BatA domain-containing protein [Parapedobacter koreensis]|uniref:N-terminal double-transmembrane domain-containing protein n=1 Tax=Parapedobacter koreensis TaxID=332977 RepID=A0A1H7GMU9_9SPHI|nr:BatA domain-containing protein [Parapedobacter koreensis]SEK39399.1 N-terminal double-transmembrane domain-containing protein [Parapedobacter koreensis]